MEELGIPYAKHKVEISEMKTEPYISVNPNGRVPAIYDPNHNIQLFESGAIIDYLIDNYDHESRLKYDSFPEKYITRCWEHFQMSGQGPYFGQKSWFELFHPERVPSAIERYSNEIRRVIGVVDTHLTKAGTDYLVGQKCTYADLMFIPYFKGLSTIFAPEIDQTQWKAYSAWLERLCRRPAVVKVLEEWDATPRPTIFKTRGVDSVDGSVPLPVQTGVQA
ncbi:URE2 [Diaporthe helianthi]|uniref:URE2 n=1 Tax=Diaporthe helianthi TaxID=158607 RepID=A0A2P5HJL3_DIAHE|nr:URE2 [Diaporthe helianthi]